MCFGEPPPDQYFANLCGALRVQDPRLTAFTDEQIHKAMDEYNWMVEGVNEQRKAAHERGREVP